MKTLTLAIAEPCGICFSLQRRIKTEELHVEIKNYSDPKDIPFFEKHSIKWGPYLVIEDGEKTEIIRGSDEIIAALKISKN